MDHAAHRLGDHRLGRRPVRAQPRGLSPEQASTRLGEQIGAQLAQPVTLTVGQGSSELVPAESGVSLDAEATMDEVAGFTLNPLTIAQRLGGAQSDAVLRVDSETLTGALEDRIDSMANGAVSATVSLEGTEVTTTPAQDGVGLDVKASVAQLSQGWPLGQQSIALAEGVAPWPRAWPSQRSPTRRPRTSSTPP